jgi:hypothetical protein
VSYDQWKADEGPETEPRGADEEVCQECGSYEPGIDEDGMCFACGEEQGDDMQNDDHDPDDLGPDPLPWETELSQLLARASDLQLKAARFALEREQARRLEDAKATIRALDPNAPKPRARRSDAGKTRAKIGGAE